MDNIKDVIDAIREIYQMLEDEESKDIYMNRLAFLLSGDYKYAAGLIASYVKHFNLDEYSIVSKHGDLKLESFRESNVKKMFQSLPEDRSFVLYGAGADGKMLLDRGAKSDKRFFGFCSSTKLKQQHGFCGYPVISPEELISQKNMCVIIATSRYRGKIMQILTDGGYPQELIIDGPAFYAKNHVESEQYFGPSFMKLQDDEVFVDAGCLDFSTSLEMSKHCKHVKVYAFEPDPQNYKTCLKNIERRDKCGIPDVKIFPYGVWSERTTLHFYACASGNSYIVSDEESNGTSPQAVSDECIDPDNYISIPVVSIDECIDPGEHVTMIKMDIEGAELEALKGARKTILRDHPKLAICIYHKPEDMWEIPLYVKKLLPEYRLYIRHHNLTPFETVLYAVMSK